MMRETRIRRLPMALSSLVRLGDASFWALLVGQTGIAVAQLGNCGTGKGKSQLRGTTVSLDL